LAVADGGTGASTAANARTNLSAASSGANSDITSITGLTTALTVAQGGTGRATLTANNVVLGNGTSAVQFVAPGTAGNVLVSNGTTWASGGAGVTSVTAGAGIAVSASTGAVTISVAADNYDAVGSYVYGPIPTSIANLSGGSTFAGSALRIYSATFNGCAGAMSAYGVTQTPSGTWRFMGIANGGNNYEVLAVRVS